MRPYFYNLHACQSLNPIPCICRPTRIILDSRLRFGFKKDGSSNVNAGHAKAGQNQLIPKFAQQVFVRINVFFHPDPLKTSWHTFLPFKILLFPSQILSLHFKH